MEFEEVIYGMLMLVLCDREGRVYDVWITFGSVHEVRASSEPKRYSAKAFAVSVFPTPVGPRKRKNSYGPMLAFKPNP